MKIQIVEKGPIFLAGMSFYGDPFHEAGDWSMDNEIGYLWRRFMDYWQKNQEFLKSISPNKDFYEAHIHTPESSGKGFFEVFVGQEVAQDCLSSLLPELCVKVFPPNQYARVDLVGDQILSDWYMDLDLQLNQKGWQRKDLYFFQVYDERFKGMDRISESELSAFIPVELSNS